MSGRIVVLKRKKEVKGHSQNRVLLTRKRRFNLRLTA